MTQVADRELSEAKLELSRSRAELEKQDMDFVKLRAEHSRLAHDNKQLTNTLNSQTNDMSKLESLVDKLQEDKQRLSLRVNKLISTGELWWGVDYTRFVTVTELIQSLLCNDNQMSQWLLMRSVP